MSAPHGARDPRERLPARARLGRRVVFFVSVAPSDLVFVVTA